MWENVKSLKNAGNSDNFNLGKVPEEKTISKSEFNPINLDLGIASDLWKDSNQDYQNINENHKIEKQIPNLEIVNRIEEKTSNILVEKVVENIGVDLIITIDPSPCTTKNHKIKKKLQISVE